MRNKKKILIAILSLLITFKCGTIKSNQHTLYVDNSKIINSLKNKSLDTKKTDFIIAYNQTMKYEGGYVNDPDDIGRETYKGISRKYNSKWTGWKIIDSCKISKNFPKNLSEIQNIELKVQNFYKIEFWNKMRGNEILNQNMANMIFDSCVNMGLSQGIKITQKILGISESGIIDDKTLNKLNSLKTDN